MQPFTTLESKAVWLDMSNVDTDQIIPSRFMRTPRAQGYGGFLFHDLRFDDQGTPKPAFPLNAPAAAGAQVLIAGENFGCGSSREAAVYALVDFGFRCIVAESFGDIFRNNAFKNCLLCVALDKQRIHTLVRVSCERAVRVDLAQQSLASGAFAARFDIEPFWKECLLEGADDIDLTLRDRAQIEAYYALSVKAQPWLLPER
jgi:3-isopropylmalate/(R)-2-methylmalate dehydratase small subunit